MKRVLSQIVSLVVNIAILTSIAGCAGAPTTHEDAIHSLASDACQPAGIPKDKDSIYRESVKPLIKELFYCYQDRARVGQVPVGRACVTWNISKAGQALDVKPLPMATNSTVMPEIKDEVLINCIAGVVEHGRFAPGLCGDKPCHVRYPFTFTNFQPE